MLSIHPEVQQFVDEDETNYLIFIFVNISLNIRGYWKFTIVTVWIQIIKHYYAASESQTKAY